MNANYESDDDAYFEALESNPLPPGVYDARLDRIEPGSNEFGDNLRWFFTIVADDGSRELRPYTARRGGSGSKPYRWMQALLGGHIEPGQKLSTSAVSGKRCRLVLGLDKSGDYNRVENLLPASEFKPTINTALNAPTLGSGDEQLVVDEVPF